MLHFLPTCWTLTRECWNQRFVYLISTKLGLWMQMSSRPYFVCTSLCMEMPSQASIVQQKLCGDLAASSLVQKKFGSNQECRSLRSARTVASWTDNQGLISPSAGLRPGKVGCFIQHTLKIGSQSYQHVFALVDWYVEDENKDKYGKPVEIWRKTFLPGGPSRYLPVARLFSKFVVASTFEDKVVIVPLNRNFCQSCFDSSIL